jgi:ligand-binding sensor domain-containing protein/two-component sensor histidine kinase
MFLLTATKQFLLQLLLFLVHLMTSRAAQAQLVNDPPLAFEHINYEQGMSTGSMVDILKDSKGFVWIVTTGGVNRYDGSEFKIFRCDASDSTTISNGLPTAITEDKNGIIWIACDIPHGLNSYNPATGKFTRYCNNPLYMHKLPNAKIPYMLIDSNNLLWMCATGEGIYSLDQKTNVIKHFEHNPDDSTSLSNNSIINGVALPNGDILFYSANSMDLFNNKTGSFTRYPLSANSNLSFGIWRPGIFYGYGKHICVPTDEGLSFLDSPMNLIVKYPDGLKRLLNVNSHKFLETTPDERIWILADSGLIVFDPFTKKYSRYIHDDHNLKSISPSMYGGLTYDLSGVMWLRGGWGVNKVNLEKEKFHIAFNNEKVNKLLPVIGEVRHSYQDHSGQIFQTKGYGVSVFNFVTKEFIPWSPDEMANKLLKGHNVQFIFQDKFGSYWLGVDGTKLILYDPSSKTSRKWMYTENHDFNSYEAFKPRSVLQDNANNIWFAGAFSICKYDMTTKRFKNYYIDKVNRQNVANSDPVIMEPGDGNIWIGTIGLSRYVTNGDSIQRILFNCNEAAKILSDSKISCTLNADSLRMWIGTDGSGMFLLDFKTGNCRRISVTDGLPNDRIFAISRDLYGTLWVSTDFGICKYIPPQNLFDDKIGGSFRTYTANFTWPAQAYSDHDGTLYFRMLGYTGLLYFHPDSLTDNPYIPPVYITDFKLFNRSVSVGDSTQVLDSTIETKRRVVLSYDQNAFSFNFAALSFINSENNRYAYRLVGFDKDWIYTDASHRVASYTNLDPGKYIFEVKASNNDDMWNKTPTTIHLIITPPWWQTWWFRILVVITVAGIIYGIYRYRLQQVIKMQMIRNNIASDLHDDVGSTLSSISYYTAAIKKQVSETNPGAISLLDKMENASADTVNAMSDIVWATNPSYDKGADLLNRMQSYASEICGIKNIHLQFEADKSFENIKLNMNVRKNIFLIFKEAVNNAVKYSGCTQLNVHLSQDEVKVKDNGKGFDTQTDFTGNGLKNMRQRAVEIKAGIEIISRQDEGCLITLKL